MAGESVTVSELSQSRLGAWLQSGGCRFAVWAPTAKEVTIRLVAPEKRDVPMQKSARGYFYSDVAGLSAGARYLVKVDDATAVPDPASHFQPEGVHGPSQVVDHHFAWSDGNWFGIPLRDYIIYELHVGTFTAEGTFDGAIGQLGRLKELGVTAVEIMPVAQFPGTRNWGYDGVGLYAVQNSYGGPEGLKRFVNAAHQHRIAVVLDVVYNHIGPEGNYLNLFGPYFTDTYKTPWGKALNFDGANSDGVRRFFVENALYWQDQFHIDALRLDAVHAIRDVSAVPFLLELSRATRQQADKVNRRFHLIAESDLNAPRFILPEQSAGYGLDAQWADDFHHTLHVLLTGEDHGYYEDYTGGVRQLAKIWREGFAFTGQYSPYRKAIHGAGTQANSLRQFVVCAQNHDQVGNRMAGDRLTTLVDFDALKLAAGTLLLSPFTPLLFMGEEYGERAPFQYFVSHTDKALLEAVRKGRKEEFASFQWAGEAPDPASAEAFERCRLRPEVAAKGETAALLALYRRLIHLRKELRTFTECERTELDVRPFERAQALVVHYHTPGTPELILILAFGKTSAEIDLDLPDGEWRLLLDSTAPEWGGDQKHFPALKWGRITLPPRAFALFRLQD